jgi:hypothetical protein
MKSGWCFGVGQVSPVARIARRVVIPGRRDRGEPGIQCGAADRNRALDSGFALTRATRNDTRSEAAANPGAPRLSV